MDLTGLVSSLSSSALLLLAAAWAATAAWRWHTVWQHRHVPGVSGTYIPLIGDLISIAKEDLTYFIEKRYSKFPKAFKVWMGRYPWVVVTDYKAGRKLLMRCIDRPDFTFMAMRRPQDQLMGSSMQVFINGDPWRVERRASEGAVLHAKALEALVPLVSQVTQKLVLQLDKFAASGEPVDVQEALWMMTTDAVGWAAFGVDLRASESGEKSCKRAGVNGTATALASPNAVLSKISKTHGVPLDNKFWEKYSVGSPEFGRNLANSVRRLMKDNDIQTATIYTPLKLLLPELNFLWEKMARLLPDARYLYTTSGHEGIQQGCKKIIEVWEKQRSAGKQNTAVSSDGILARVLSGGSHEAKLKEHELMGLVTGTVIAGFETTGTSIAMALYLLATHPEAQARAQKEVDDVLQGKNPMTEDLEHLQYISGIFMESNRLYSPAAMAFRAARSSLDLGGGVIIPKGARIIFPIFSYMRDPAIWPRALEFLPERHIQPGNEELAPSDWSAFLPFGHGSRLCVGYKFAIMEARMALARLIQCFTFGTVPGEPFPHSRTSVTFKPDNIKLRVTRRQQAV